MIKRKLLLQLLVHDLCVLTCVVLFVAMVVPAYATTITVTNTNDDGPGSLRQTLADVNDGDTIEFAVTGKIELTSGELVIDHGITINGLGANMLAVSQSLNTQFRVFHVMPGLTVSIRGLTISDGYAAGDVGGGILNDQAALTLTNCSILNNVAHGGGGVYTSDGGSLTIINSVISGNSAVGDDDPYGGGISSGSLTVINSTISGNSAVGDFPFTFGYGGGISGSGTITNSTIQGNYSGLQAGGIGFGGTITDSTISNNSAGGGKNYWPGGGGGMDFSGTISNCTVSGNSAFGDDFKGPGLGGGIYAFSTVTINNCTFSGNYLNYGNGDSIYNRGTLEIGNTILNNAGFLGGNIFNDAGTITSAGYNLSNDDGGGYLNSPGDQINTDPFLGSLQDNGGSTFTHELLAGSPAIDAGNPKFTPPPYYDQRGPDFYRLRNTRIDIGSFEVQEGPAVTPPPTPTPTATATPTPSATPTATPRVTPRPRPRPTPLPRPTPPRA